MKQIEKIASGKNFDAANVGRLNELGDYTLEFGPDIKIPGKVFAGKVLTPQDASYHSSYSPPEPRQDFYTPTKTTKRYTSSSKARGNFR